MSGISSTPNSMSTTGPMTRATRPVPASWVSGAVSATAVISFTPALVTACSCIGQRVGAPDDLADLLGDLGLTGGVGRDRVLLDELGRVVGRGLHRPAAGRQLRGGRLQHRVVDPALDVAGEQRVEHVLGRRLELVEG